MGKIEKWRKIERIIQARCQMLQW